RLILAAKLDSTVSIFVSSLSMRRSRRVSTAARSSLVAMCLTTCVSISPSSLRVVFFAAICGEYTTADLWAQARAGFRRRRDRWATDLQNLRRWQALHLQKMAGVRFANW